MESPLMQLLENIKIGILAHVIWKLFPRELDRSIARFSETEADTVWQLIHGIEKVHSGKQRAEVFYQILEEDFHAEEFQRVYRGNTGKPLERVEGERRFLYRKEDPVWKLFAYCFVGEKDATERFSAIERMLPPSALKEVLRSIIRDETGHVVKAEALMKELGASKTQIQLEKFKIRFQRLYESWIRIGKRIGFIPSEIILSTVYFFFGFLLKKSAKQRMGQRLFHNCEDSYLLRSSSCSH